MVRATSHAKNPTHLKPLNWGFANNNYLMSVIK